MDEMRKNELDFVVDKLTNSIQSKTKLIEHYEKTLGAYNFGGHKMIIATEVSEFFVQKYFKT